MLKTENFVSRWLKSLHESKPKLPNLTELEKRQADLYKSFIEKVNEGKSVVSDVVDKHGRITDVTMASVPYSEADISHLKDGFSDACGLSGWTVEEVVRSYIKSKGSRNKS